MQPGLRVYAAGLGVYAPGLGVYAALVRIIPSQPSLS